MLRITAQVASTPAGPRIRLILEGRIVGQWISELEKEWMRVQQDYGLDAATEVDLEGVSYISESGAALIRAMDVAGVKLVANHRFTLEWIEELRH